MKIVPFNVEIIVDLNNGDYSIRLFPEGSKWIDTNLQAYLASTVGTVVTEHVAHRSWNMERVAAVTLREELQTALAARFQTFKEVYVFARANAHPATLLDGGREMVCSRASTGPAGSVQHPRQG